MTVEDFVTILGLVKLSHLNLGEIRYNCPVRKVSEEGQGNTEAIEKPINKIHLLFYYFNDHLIY